MEERMKTLEANLDANLSGFRSPSSPSSRPWPAAACPNWWCSPAGSGLPPPGRRHAFSGVRDI